MIKLYNSRPVERYDFTGHKRFTVPKQSMSLGEIVRRFVRRESVPVATTEGIYETRFGDLEKIKNMDMFDQLEIAEDLKGKIKDFNVRSQKEAAAAAEAAKKAEADEIEKRIAAEVAKKITGQTVP